TGCKACPEMIASGRQSRDPARDPVNGNHHKERPMANEPKKDGEGAAGAQPTLNVLAQYVKDLSFENPGAPRSLGAREKAPQIGINVNVNANPLSQTDFDVNLTLNAE